MMKYSVIVPVYNAEKYIERCVFSILEQEFDDFELILIDDGSTDSSLQICQHFAANDQRVIVLQQQNAGVSAARNAGLRVSKGEFVLFLDADDYVALNYFCMLDQYAGKFDLLEFGHYDLLVDGNDTVISIAPSKLCCDLGSGTDLPWKDFFLKSFFASPWNKLYKRDLLTDLWFDTQCVCYEDYLFNVAYCERIKSFKAIKEPIYYYRQSSSIHPVSKRKWSKRFLISKKVATATKVFITNHSESPEIHSLNAYPYGAYIVELQAAAACGTQELKNASDELVRNEIFGEVIVNFHHTGKRIEILKRLIELKLYQMASFWLRKALIT